VEPPAMIGSLPPDHWASVLRWLVWLGLAGVLARPLVLRLMPGAGGGWIMAKLLAWLVAGWVPWVLASFHILPFDRSSMAGVLVLALVALRLGLGPRDLRGALTVEAAFLIPFWLGLAAKLSHPELTGLEKFTDMGFLSAAMRTDWMPPQDAWFAGHALNYYYVGQAMVGAWGNLAGVSRPRLSACHGHDLCADRAGNLSHRPAAGRPLGRAAGGGAWRAGGGCDRLWRQRAFGAVPAVPGLDADHQGRVLLS